jgi:hypothetical protein
MSKLSSLAIGILWADERGFGGVLYDACGAGRCGVIWLDVDAGFRGEDSGTGLREGASDWVRCAGDGSVGVRWCRGEPSSRGPALTPRSPRCSGVCTGDGVAPVGSLGSGRRLTGAISRAPPTAALPSGLADSLLFCSAGFSFFSRVS